MGNLGVWLSNVFCSTKYKLDHGASHAYKIMPWDFKCVWVVFNSATKTQGHEEYDLLRDFGSSWLFRISISQV